MTARCQHEIACGSISINQEFFELDRFISKGIALSYFKHLLVGLVFFIGTAMSDEIKAQIVSPDVDGKKVTFRLRAPSAKSVKVKGIHGVSAKELTLGKNGIWSATLGPLEPELYSYSFEVDGTQMVDPSNRMVKKWLSLNSMFEIKGGLLHEQKQVPHGEVIHLQYHSTTTDSDRGVYVYTPPGYHGSDQKNLPVVYLLHGYGDDESAWIEVGRTNQIVDNLIAEKKIQPMVIVMPYGHPLPIELRREFDDYAEENLEQMEADLLKSLMPFVESRFRVGRTPNLKSIVGLSMGGGQSISIGLNHFQEFSRVGGFSSATPQGETKVLDQRFAKLLAEQKSNEAPLDLLWIACGKDDFLLKRNNQFHEWLKQNKIDCRYQISEGGHDWMVWRKYLAEFLIASFPKN